MSFYVLLDQVISFIEIAYHEFKQFLGKIFIDAVSARIHQHALQYLMAAVGFKIQKMDNDVARIRAKTGGFTLDEFFTFTDYYFVLALY